MLIVGLTGGIASGKSLVTRVLRDLGAHIIDADKIVHDLLAPGQDACREVVGHFGKGIQLPDGSIDRRKLGDIIFNHPEERAWLNQCIHPRVFEAYNHQVRHLSERQPDAIVIMDAALLIETGYHKHMDRLIVVYADQKAQMKRLMERDRFTLEQAMARISSQMPLDEKRKYADFVIENTGTREATEQQTREVFAKLKAEAGRRE
ncbi:MAG: dephospho-CoA kinase [Nitrospirae bacterium]|jgi:dephospho-CoA kinase|nr:dephospho-CoA kinase [Nitrospirota bacterium]